MTLGVRGIGGFADSGSEEQGILLVQRFEEDNVQHGIIRGQQFGRG